MQKTTLFLTFLITLALSLLVIVFLQEKTTVFASKPQELYKVYLAGNEIGIIKSKNELEKLIDKKQDLIKEKLNVKTIYAPAELDIQKYIGYESEINSSQEIYDLIEKTHPFTVKGYEIEIKDREKLYVIDRDIFEEAVNDFIKAFIDEEQYEKFKTSSQTEIKETGSLLENVYLQEEIIIKEGYISVLEDIYIDEKDLAKYLIFGTTKEQGKYTVKSGDSIEEIAFNNQLGVNEFFIVNPQFNNVNTLLAPGQEVSIGLIEPILSLIVEEHVVEDQEILFKTEYEYDPEKSVTYVKVVQEGSKGLQRITQKIQSVNGEILAVQIDRSATQLLKSPVTKKVIKGTRTSTGFYVHLDGDYGWPTNSPYKIFSYFGYRINPVTRERALHEGIDISGPGHGSPIYAVADGTVVTSGSHVSYGNYIVISHADNLYTLYAHNSLLYARVGQTVKKGQIISLMGSTGRSSGTHLHFGTYIGMPHGGGRVFNPLQLYK